ncbi:hypothetical protein [Kitasatospora camelliae]|uniref:Uncharacterized protein n=1 Tax=Kitasatospora camelliae TaxID=3156397 RepID=A0AAU8K1J5_9ACTN
MTVGHDRGEAVFHAFPDGTELYRYGTDRFTPEGADEDGEGEAEPLVDWDGGYLDAANAVILVTDREEEITVPYVVDLPTGAVRGRLTGDPRPHGDGTWTTVGPDARLTLWTLG